MSTQLALANAHLPNVNEWNTMLQMADMLIQSGLAPTEVKTPAAALVIMQKGRELGIPPLYALSNISVIKGKPVAGAELLLAVVYRDHGDNAVQILQTDATACHVAYKRRSWPSAREFTFTIQDAKQAGLMNNPTWQKYPQAMLRARCLSAVARMGFPDSIGGMYTPEELGATVTVNDEGAVEIAAPEPQDHFRDVTELVDEPMPDEPPAPQFTVYDFDLPNEPLERLRAARQHIKDNEPGNPEYRGICLELQRRASATKATEPEQPVGIPGVANPAPAERQIRATDEQRERYRNAREVAASFGITSFYQWPPHITESEASASLDALSAEIAEKEREQGYEEIAGDPIAEVIMEGQVVEAAAA